MKGTIWQFNEDVVVVRDVYDGTGDCKGEQFVTLTDGSEPMLTSLKNLTDDGVALTPDYKPQDWEHVTQLESSGTEDDLGQLMNLIMLQCMDITQRGVVPFELVPDEVGNLKRLDTLMDNAVGYWEKAVAVLDSEQVGEDEAPRLVIKVVLSGKIFLGKFEEIGVELEEETIGEQLMALPRFAAPEEDPDKISTVSFDLKLRQLQE